jgi:hypothetical protein
MLDFFLFLCQYVGKKMAYLPFRPATISNSARRATAALSAGERGNS